jgi:hypothetical protein
MSSLFIPIGEIKMVPVSSKTGLFAAGLVGSDPLHKSCRALNHAEPWRCERPSWAKVGRPTLRLAFLSWAARKPSGNIGRRLPGLRSGRASELREALS